MVMVVGVGFILLIQEIYDKKFQLLQELLLKSKLLIVENLVVVGIDVLLIICGVIEVLCDECDQDVLVCCLVFDVFLMDVFSKVLLLQCLMFVGVKEFNVVVNGLVI